MDFTFLVCTYNRSNHLADLLESALAQDAASITYEIVVVDNNSTDDTAQTVERFQESSGDRLRYVFEGRQGKSYALNTGLQHLRGRFYIVADDDLVFPANYLTTVHRHFVERPDLSFLGGKVVPMWRREPPSWLTWQHWLALAMTTYGETEFPVNSERPVCLLAAVFCADDVREVAGYNVQLGVSKTDIGGVEDVEIFNRLFRAGKYGLYAPDVCVYHKVESERLTKSYHRRWHTGHGRQIARLRDPAVERSRRRIFDVPAHVYRAATTAAFNWARHLATGNVSAAFYEETQVRYFWGFMSERWFHQSGRRRASGGRDAERQATP